MSDFKERYPLCEQAKLWISVHQPSTDLGRAITMRDWVLASDVEKLLSDAPVVYGDTAELNGLPWRKHLGGQTHRARLIMIEPIKQKSREERAIELLREIAEFKGDLSEWYTLHEKAKQLLSESES